MIDVAEEVARAVVAAGFAVALAVSGVVTARARGRSRARASGLARRVGARIAWALSAVPYAVVCVVLWRPLPVHPSVAARAVALCAGTCLIAAGWSLYTWGRSALGDMYNVSGALGSELYAGHRLVASGPYRVVRHPMYVGIALGALGALLLYRTWAMVFAVVVLPAAVVKIRREERLLAEEFPQEHAAYRARVPAVVPRVGRRVEEVTARARGSREKGRPS
ncbi:MAG: isoprenylcysteine carboxylmethyltransferase family protein [Actinomycetota bacterium]